MTSVTHFVSIILTLLNQEDYKEPFNIYFKNLDHLPHDNPTRKRVLSIFESWTEKFHYNQKLEALSHCATVFVFQKEHEYIYQKICQYIKNIMARG